MGKNLLVTVTAEDRDDLRAIADDITIPSWPEFMLNDAVANTYWYRLYETFPEYQFVLMNPHDSKIPMAANSVPLAWDGPPEELPDEGWDWALAQAFEDYDRKRKPTVLCALQIVIRKEDRRQGLSAAAVNAMKEIARRQGLSRMIAPVRPNLKSLYPLTPMEHYIKWLGDDDLPFDNWLRVHARLGARIIKVCPQAMHISGTVADWEKWAGLRFPESGIYVVPGALTPVEINLENDRGVYIEPNVWMLHRL